MQRLLKNAYYFQSSPSFEPRILELLNTIDEYSPEEKLIAAAILHNRDKFLEILEKYPIERKDEKQPQEGNGRQEFFKELLYSVMNPELPRPESCNTLVLDKKIAEIET